MSLLLDLSLRACLILAVGLAASAAMRRRSAAVRHAVLAITIVAAGVAAPLSGWLPAWNVAMPLLTTQPSSETDAWLAATSSEAVAASETATAPAAAAASDESDGSRLVLTGLVVAAWGVGVAACLGTLLAGIVHLLRIERRSQRLTAGVLVDDARDIAAQLGVRRAIALVQTDGEALLATWGALRPSLLLPRHAAEWSADRRRIVLTHEIAHIRRNDWLVQLAADVVRAAFWFNPLFWIACARLRRDSEQACDDCVLGAGFSGDRYATHLLALVRRGRRAVPRLASAVPMARSSTLERRIAAMLNPALNRTALSKRGLVLAATLMAIVAVPIAALRAEQTSPLPLTGVIYDPTGAVVPQVAVTVEDEQKTKLYTGTTDGSGRFTIDAVAPGKYVLVAELPGFRALRQPMELRYAKDWQRIVTLQVGTLQETINIRAVKPVPTRPSAGSNVGPRPVRVGGNIKAPTKTHNVNPVYPPSMQEAGLEGVVPLEAIISREGTVQSMRVLSAQVHPDFVKAAMDAVSQWQFTPTLLNGTPIEVMMNVTLTFSLSDK